MRKNLLFIIFCLLFVPNMAIAQQPLSADVLNQPIVEGRGAAGINLGDTEATVVEKMGGLPHVVQGFGKPQKTLTYGNMTEKGGIGINIFMENNSVIGIEVISVPTIQGHVYKGKSQKGFQFGNPLEKVKTMYGEPYKAHSNGLKILWYKKEGIIFEYSNFIDKGVGKGPATDIVIIKSNANIPQHLKERGSPEGLWE